MKPIFNDCGKEYNPKRREYGFYTCLPCGSVRANREIKRKANAQHQRTTKVHINMSARNKQHWE